MCGNWQWSPLSTIYEANLKWQPLGGMGFIRKCVGNGNGNAPLCQRYGAAIAWPGFYQKKYGNCQWSPLPTVCDSHCAAWTAIVRHGFYFKMRGNWQWLLLPTICGSNCMTWAFCVNLWESGMIPFANDMLRPLCGVGFGYDPRCQRYVAAIMQHWLYS